MNKKCIGCGAILQNDDVNKDGFIDGDLFNESTFCKRCFRLKNYGEYSLTNKDNSFYEKILSNINNTNDLVIQLVDLFDISNLENVTNIINNKVILVLTKRDLLPKSVKDNKIIARMKQEYKNYVDYVVISSNKNYNLDLLYQLIKKHRTSNKVYIVGSTNSGKSTLINKIIKNYSKNSSDITTSYLPSTTLDAIEIMVNDNLTIVDTPGLLNPGNIVNQTDFDTVKKITPRSEIKPRVYQIVKECSLLIENLCRIDYVEDKSNSLSFYISNDLNIKKTNINTNNYLKDLKKHSIDAFADEDVVIEGLCFIKIVKRCKLDIYIQEGVNVYKRDKLI